MMQTDLEHLKADVTMRKLVLEKRRLVLAQRREQRELFFWTASRLLRLVVMVACAIGVIVGLADGDMHVLIHAIAVLR